MNLRQCQLDKWQCGDGDCIPYKALCDGFGDCIDGSDETRTSCPDGVTCQEDEYSCQGEGDEILECIPKRFLCDGDKDCPHGDDEKNCHSE